MRLIGWYNNLIIHILNSPNNQAENVLHNGCYTKVVMHFIYILRTGHNNFMVNRTNMKYRTVGIKVIRYLMVQTYYMIWYYKVMCVDSML